MDLEVIRNIQKKIKSSEMLLVFDKAEIFYILKKYVDGITLAIFNDEILCLTSNMIKSQVIKLISGIKIISAEGIEQQLKSLNRKIKILLLNNNVSIDMYDRLKKKYKIKYSKIISELRMIKNNSEIKSIRQASVITLKILNLAIQNIRCETTEIEVKNYILKKCLDFGVEPSFEPIVAFDENTAYPHHISSEKRFSRKSFVMIDMGCKVDGYCSDVTRMFFVEAAPLVKFYYKKLLELQKKLISMCLVGTKVANIDNFARKFCRRLNIENNYLHTTGHSLGIEIHEMPRISIKDKTVLKEGMVITIEPGIYFDNESSFLSDFNNSKYNIKNFGLRKEDVVLIEKKGPQVLTN